MEKIGLIAGGGVLPVIFAEEARKKGVKVVGFAIKDMASQDLDGACSKVHHIAAGEFKKFFFLLLFERVKKVAILGKIEKSIIYSDIKKDTKALKYLKETESKSDYRLLDKITTELKKIGIELISGTEYLASLFPVKGVLTKREPSDKERGDISFGLGIAKEMARMDIGQTVVVKDKNVVSVEAMEGTNKAIERSSALCGEGFTVVKVARPKQDMRWDVPAIGPETIKLIARGKGNVLVMEEKKMYLVDEAACRALADENNISIVVV